MKITIIWALIIMAIFFGGFMVLSIWSWDVVPPQSLKADWPASVPINENCDGIIFPHDKNDIILELKHTRIFGLTRNKINCVMRRTDFIFLRSNLKNDKYTDVFIHTSARFLIEQHTFIFFLYNQDGLLLSVNVK